MKDSHLKEIVSGGILILLLVLLLNPFSFWMPTMFVLVVLVAVLSWFSMYATFVLREKVTDEREFAHRLSAGRIAYVLGTIVLIIGIVYEETNGKLDSWLVFALVTMIMAKLIARRYSDIHE